MSSDLIRHPVRWTSSYETTEAVQPVAPIKGILRDLRSNQWLVLTRSSDTEKSEFFPFRKSELVERLADAEPLSIASEVLNLPEHGAKAVNKRIWSVESREDEPVESLRMVWIDERGALLGVGVSRYDLSIQRTISEHELIMETRAIAMEKEVAIEDHVRGLADTEQKPNVVRKTGAEPPSLIVPVFYATDRKRDPKSPAEDVHFTSERAPNEVVSLGVCSVSIPKTHHIGKLERPPKWKIWARPKRNEHVMLLSTIELSTEEFWNQLNASVAESTRQDVFIFVHGYNVSFEVAALRSAQLATDLSFQGAPIMFSWPSKGGLARYLSDEGAIQWSRPHLRRFIEDVCTTSNADVVHLIAHSMGSRALVEVVEALSKASLPKNTLKQLIFAAPDVDSGVFQQVAKVLSTTCARVTLYASDRDKALKLSKTIHGFPRAGEAGTGLVIVPGVDTIDASLVDTDFLGHSGFATDAPLMQDIFYIVQHGHAPNQRFGLDQRSCPLGTYWSFKE